MKRYYRSDTDKIIAGVCGGLAKTLRISPLLLRIAFVIAAMINGIGLVAYVLLWLFMAPEHTAFENTDEMVRQNVQEMRQRARELGRDAQHALGGTGRENESSNNRILIAGGVLIGLGLLVLLSNLGLLWWIGRLWPLLLIALGAVLLLNNLRDRG
ncbi:MAG: PspC domain-containing protein [Anaerolineae bacterium]|nr:PspC domain-containing protein [Anaerolineae bacterium]